jgi:hypothetical protein
MTIAGMGVHPRVCGLGPAFEQGLNAGLPHRYQLSDEQKTAPINGGHNGSMDH